MTDEMVLRLEGLDAQANVFMDATLTECTGIRLIRGKEADLKAIEPVKVNMPCGELWELSRDNLPIDDVPCRCGDPKHWFFRWGKAPEGEFVATQYP